MVVKYNFQNAQLMNDHGTYSRQDPYIKFAHRLLRSASHTAGKKWCQGTLVEVVVDLSAPKCSAAAVYTCCLRTRVVARRTAMTSTLPIDLKLTICVLPYWCRSISSEALSGCHADRRAEQPSGPARTCPGRRCIKYKEHNRSSYSTLDLDSTGHSKP